MKCTWLGQAGLLFDFNGKIVMVDPYFSDSVAKINPANKRRVAVNEDYFRIRPDILILTHDHLDHTDPETLEILLKHHQPICILASQNAWKHARAFGGKHNYVLFDRGTQWTYDDIRFTAVHAQHSDNNAIGVIISHQGSNYYVAGDTLYHTQVIVDIQSVCKQLDVIFLPVNGVGNNMNMIDAARLAQQINAKKVVPIHFGMFDKLDPLADFHCDNKIVPKIYEEIKL